ncbi:MAG: transglutaminase domain-containing protein [Anaerolineales bacterium]|nr:transglutaminase domain-containing protein [Anaerolineales bacterium]
MNKAVKRLLFISLGVIAMLVTTGTAFNWYLSSRSYDPNYDYLSVLKSSPAYDYTEKADVTFSYQSKDDPGLVNLRELYHLGTIAGTGTDLEKSQNMLKWVQETIRHDGSYPLPSKRDAISLIEYTQSSGHGLNCRGLAIVLSESLLSVGVKARFVELLPRDFSSESHVVTLAYLSELDQWMYLDPTYQAYFVDETNHYLDIAEIRSGLITGSLLQANSSINYNGGPVDVDYLHYLAKNFYRFASPQVSAFGIDSSPDRKMVTLNPMGNDSGRRNPFAKNQVIHNPDVFWAKP